MFNVGSLSLKFFSRLGTLSVLFLVCLSIFLGATPVRADSRAVISIDKTVITTGSTTVVTVKAKGVPGTPEVAEVPESPGVPRVPGVPSTGLAGYTFKIEYEPAIVNLIGLSGTSDMAHPVTTFAAPEPNPSKVPGEILVIAAQHDGSYGDIELCKLTFQAVGTTAQVSPLTLTVVDFSHSNLSNILYTIVNGSLTIVSGLAPTLSVSPDLLSESSANDGSLTSGEMTLTLTDGIFATDIGKPDITLTGLPAGMDFTVTRMSDTTLKVTLAGNATSHDNTNDATLALSVAHAKVIGANADITGTIGLDFILNEGQTNNDATLSEITLSTGTLTPTFDKDVTAYSVSLPTGSTVVPTVSSVTSDTGATVQVTQASNINGTVAERTAMILVTAQDGTTTKSYAVVFSVTQSTAQAIQSVVPTRTSQTSGIATNVSIEVTTAGISSGTAITVELVNSDGSSLSPVVSGSSTVQNDSANVTLNVLASVAPGSYKLKVVSSGVTNNSTDYNVLPKFGDVNNTGDINITDALQVLKAITNPSLFNSTQRIAADVNGDGSVNITDGLLILKHITNPVPFPIENR